MDVSSHRPPDQELTITRIVRSSVCDENVVLSQLRRQEFGILLIQRHQGAFTSGGELFATRGLKSHWELKIT
jgi:hypothetical protein